MSGGYVTLERESARAESFDFVFNAHHDYVYNLAYCLLRNAQDAEDVTQDIFLRVYKALPSYDPERASMRTWLTKMAVNACQTHRRRNFLRNLMSRESDPDGEAPEPVDPSLWGAPEDRALQSEVRRTVNEVLTRLRPEHRTVLVLHYYLDLSCPEIARILECPEGTVYSRLHYARRVVQTRLEHHLARQGGELAL